MKIFVTGVEGYIGCLLAPMLVDRGHEVIGLDAGFYRDGWLYTDKATFSTFPNYLNKDLRNIEQSDLEGVDAIVHLAELSNDPLGQNNPEITFDINHKGSVRLAKIAKESGVNRFIYTSSCSVYGVGDGGELNESSQTNPQTAYAECKINVEADVSAMAEENFSPVFLRNATAYGPSPRMRFDIVLNNLSGLAKTESKIVMTSDGSPWRPLVHVLDICKAIICAIDAPKEAIHNEIFNVGDTKENYQVRDIATIVSEEFPGCELSFGPSGGDNRSYRVNFDKIAGQLPGFSCDWTARKGAKQLYDLFSRIDMSKQRFEERPFTRLKQLKYLIETEQLNEKLFWNF